ncbi:MAG: tetratricopeptide repeat protein [Deltaproteobacteria bacterium]|nr:tetratricopeptide repeat protein [Deltaproteobacteria bacterium]
MENIRELITRGKQYFERKQYNLAEHYLKRVIERQPQYADVQNMLGVISHIEGKFHNALEFFRSALNINPRYTEALLNLAVLYNDLGQYKEAKELYTALKKQNVTKKGEIEPVLRGKLSNLHAEVGDIYRSIALHSLAIEEYQKALTLNPHYHDIRTKLGQALRENRELVASQKEFLTVLKARERYSPARVQLGVTLYSMGKPMDARKQWETVLGYDPQNDYAKMYLRLCEPMPRDRIVSGNGAKKVVKKTTKKAKPKRKSR